MHYYLTYMEQWHHNILRFNNHVFEKILEQSPGNGNGEGGETLHNNPTVLNRKHDHGVDVRLQGTITAMNITRVARNLIFHFRTESRFNFAELAKFSLYEKTKQKQLQSVVVKLTERDLAVLS